MSVEVGRRLALRSEQPEDDAVSMSILAGTREPELALLPWDDGQKAAFITQQHRAQQHAYRGRYPEASFDFVVIDGDVVGRLYVARSEAMLYIIDIALLPAWRNHGIGEALLGDLLAEAARSGRTVQLHVEVGNPAAGLYERLGFRPVGREGVHCLMVATPSVN